MSNNGYADPWSNNDPWGGKAKKPDPSPAAAAKDQWSGSWGSWDENKDAARKGPVMGKR